MLHKVAVLVMLSDVRGRTWVGGVLGACPEEAPLRMGRLVRVPVQRLCGTPQAIGALHGRRQPPPVVAAVAAHEQHLGEDELRERGVGVALRQRVPPHLHTCSSSDMDEQVVV